MKLFKQSWSAYLSKDFESAYMGFLKVLKNIDENRRVRNRAFDCAAFMLLRMGANANDINMLIDIAKDVSLTPPTIDQYLASIALFNKDFSNFWKFITRCSVYDADSMGPWSRGRTTLPKSKDWYRIINSGNFKYNNMININNYCKKASDPYGYVMLFSSNSDYFIDFYEFPILSVKRTGMNAFMHFHVINPDDKALEIIEYIRNRYRNVCISIEYSNILSKAYYASSRFLSALQIIEYYRKPMFIFDIDIKFNKDLNGLFISSGWDRDLIGIRYTDNIALPWQKMTASAMYFPFNSLSISYLARVRSYLFPWFNDPSEEHDLWWIDQNAIYFSLLDMLMGKGFEYQVWGARLDYLRFPSLFEDKISSLSNRTPPKTP